MIDPILGRICAPLLDRLVVPLRGRGPLLSGAGFLVCLAGAALIARHCVWLGLGVFAAGLVLDALATRLGPQPLDFLLAAVRFAAMPFAFALDTPERAIALIFLLFGMTVEAVARTRLGSILGAGEFLLLFVLLALIPGGLVAYGAGLLCFVAAGFASARRG
jgi:hypothetical protein